MKRSSGFRFLIIFGIVLNIMLLAGQTLSLFDHDLTVSLGLQESRAEISDAGIAFALGFAFGDTVVYIPLFLAGIIGLLREKPYCSPSSPSTVSGGCGSSTRRAPNPDNKGEGFAVRAKPPAGQRRPSQGRGVSTSSS